MTTLTKISAGEQARISLNPRNVISRINDNTYGGFTEHMGRCIYGGIYDPGNPLSDEDGFRKDVIEAMREIKVPVVRYPGGNFVATYHWMDGIGPREQRPRRPELAWLGVESNEFGTDEFMKWCEKVGAEPYLCFNFGTGTLDEALGWVEYCNGTKDTYYANLRRKNGREEPYNVKYWALGNEVYGAWQVAQMTKEDYAKKAYQWAKALKLLDPSIQLILCGESGFSSWDSYVIKECIRFDPHGLADNTTSSLIDMHSIHLYTASSDHLQNVTGLSHETVLIRLGPTLTTWIWEWKSAPLAAERAIEITAGLIDLARAENKVPPTVPRQKICFDEWNVWDMFRAPGEQGAEEQYTLSDALAVSVWLNVFVRQSKHIGMANIAQSVNVISPLMTDKNGITKQPTWWPLFLFSKYMRGSTIAVHLHSTVYNGPTRPEWVRGTVETPWLDVSAAIDDDGVVTLAVVNISSTEDIATEIDGISLKDKQMVEVYRVSGENVGVTNRREKEDVLIQEGEWDGEGLYRFPKHSLTMLRWNYLE